MIVASVVILLVSVALPLMIHACATGRIPVNHLAGIRIASVMASENAWRAGHKAAIPTTWIGAAVAVVLAGTSLIPWLPDEAKSGLTIGAAIVLVAAVIVAGVFANRAALLVVGADQDEREEQHR